MVSETRQIIVGDVGGTNVRLAVARVSDDRIELATVWKHPGARFATFSEALEAFLSVAGEANFAGAALGLAGPVSGGRVELLHRAWTIDARDIGKRLGGDTVVLVNDFVAMARSAPELEGAETVELSEGAADADGNIVIGGPGTGFGLGTLKLMRGGKGPSGWVVVGGEGGHQLFAPQNELEWKIAERLRADGVYVSNEIIASGSGFEQTLAALADVLGVKATEHDPGRLVELARAGDRLGVEMCRLRARCTMAALGDAALAANATGGIFVAGGVSPHLRDWLREPEALARFRERGPRSALLAHIPIRLITGDTVALTGAAALWRDQQTRGWL